MRVKLCARCPYAPRDLADYYDANSGSHLCFRCDSKSAPAGLAILVTANRESKCATAENILNAVSGDKPKLSATESAGPPETSFIAVAERLYTIIAARSFSRTERACSTIS